MPRTTDPVLKAFERWEERILKVVPLFGLIIAAIISICLETVGFMHVLELSIDSKAPRIAHSAPQCLCGAKATAKKKKRRASAHNKLPTEELHPLCPRATGRPSQ